LEGMPGVTGVVILGGVWVGAVGVTVTVLSRIFSTAPLGVRAYVAAEPTARPIMPAPTSFKNSLLPGSVINNTLLINYS
jgi:hypothetical protein